MRTVDPKKTPLTTRPTSSASTLDSTTYPKTVAEAVAAERKKADDENAHRMAMNVLGLADDPLKAAVEKVIPGRVDIFGRLTKDPRSI
jgi:hypothetical protein